MAAGGGRKDAFPGADGSTITQVNPNAETIPIYGADGSVLTEGSEIGLQKVDITTSGVIGEDNTSLIYTIKKPLSYITNAEQPIRDWYTLEQVYQNNLLWENSIVKAIYDPCPKGWHIPSDGTWNDFSVENCPYYINGIETSTGNRTMTNGRLYNHFTWHPASGYRTYNASGLYNNGYVGTNWSLQSDDNGYLTSLFFNSQFVNPHGLYGRANGFSVRCIQE